MSWGHAVVHDLMHWEHLPVALSEENDVMIFSGSAVVDWKNTSGLGQNGKPPLVAIYTGHYTKKPLQNQNIAYSNDRGRTWTKYAGNPVLDIGEKDFRDPKVSWHEASRTMDHDRGLAFAAQGPILRVAGSETMDSSQRLWACGVYQWHLGMSGSVPS